MPARRRVVACVVALLAGSLAWGLPGAPSSAVTIPPAPSACAANAQDTSNCLMTDDSVATVSASPNVVDDIGRGDWVADPFTVTVTPAYPTIGQGCNVRAAVCTLGVGLTSDHGEERVRYLGPLEAYYDTPTTFSPTYCEFSFSCALIFLARFDYYPTAPNWMAVMVRVTVSQPDPGRTLGYVERRVYIETAVRITPVRNPGAPVASFDAHQVEPGSVFFESTSTDPQGDAMSYEWVFGDGTTDVGPAAFHQYGGPGSYDVTHRVTDVYGNADSVTQTVVVKAPSLEVGLSFVDRESASFEPGEELTVRLSVAASADGLRPLTAVTFAPALAWTPTETLQLVSGPSPAIPTSLTLQPGAAATTFEFKLKAVGTGHFTLRADASAKDALGRTVDPPAVERAGQVSVLKVSVTFATNPIDLVDQEPVDADGDGLDDSPGFEPQKVKGTITLENTGTDTLEHLHVTGNEQDLDLRMFKRVGGSLVPIESPTPFPMAVTAAPVFKPYTSPGTLGPGEKQDLVFEVEARGRGLFGVATTALGDTESGTPVSGRGEGVLTARADVELRVQMKVGTVYGRPPKIDEGQYYLVFGTAKNVTTDETISLKALLPGVDGNGVALGPVLSPDNPPELPCSNHVIAPTLAPGESVDFTLRVLTKPVLNTPVAIRQVSMVSVPFEGTATDADGRETTLDDTSVDVELGNGKTVRSDGSQWLRVEVTPKLVVPRLLTRSEQYASEIDAFAESLVLGVSDWGVQTLNLLGFLARTGGSALRSIFDGTAAGVLGKQLVDAGAFLAHLYVSMNPLEQQEFRAYAYQQVLESMGAAILDTEEAIRAMDQGIDAYFDGLYSWFTRADAAADRGDLEELARLEAAPLRAATTAVVDQIVSEAVIKSVCSIFTKSPKAIGPAQAKAAALEAEAPAKVEAAVEEVRAQGDPRAVGQNAMKELDPWTPIDPAGAAGGFAVDAVSDANLRAYTKQIPVMVAIRSRAAETLEWLKQSLGITLKPEPYKPKMTNEIDRLFLSYRDGPPGYGTGDIGSAILAEPIPFETLRERLQGLPANQWARVYDRWAVRYREWYGYYPDEVPTGKLSKVQELKDLARRPITEPGVKGTEGVMYLPKEGTIIYGGNLDTRGPAIQLEGRRLQLRQVANPPDNALFEGGREYLEVWLEDADGRMKRIAGDIDTVGAWGMDGRWLTNDQAVQVVTDLTRVSGARHAWTITWSDAAGRAELLADHAWHPNPARRGAPMLLYANGEARLAWFDAAKNYAADEGPSFVFLEGAPHTFDPVEWPSPFPKIDLPDPSDAELTGWAAPRDSLQLSPDLGGPTTPKCAVVTSDAPDARVLRLGDDGHIQEWTPEAGWRNVDPKTLCVGRKPLTVRPQSGVLTSTDVGARELPVIQPTGTGAGAGFTIGQTIVIDPGGPHQEVALVMGFGSPVLAQELKYPHAAGEIVAALDASTGEMPATR